MAERDRRQKSTQGPAKRPAPSSKPLTLEEKRQRQRKERERIRREREERAKRAALRRMRRKRLLRLSFAVSLVFVLLYWCFVALSIFNRDQSEDQTLPLLIFIDGVREEDDRFEKEEVNIGGTSYLPVTFLEKYMAISQFGDHKTRSFLLCDGGEYATFYLGSEEALVNGVRVSLKDKSLLIDGQLYLPVSFFADKMTCFTLSESVAAYGTDVLTYYEGREGFRFHTAPASPTVDFATVPVAPATPTDQTA